MMKKQCSIRHTAHAGCFKEDDGEVPPAQDHTRLGKHE
jgi:hypothetical protein